jgi:hypothetical protein
MRLTVRVALADPPVIRFTDITRYLLHFSPFLTDLLAYL